MAKTAKLKKRQQPSAHSRSARRAASPSLDAPSAAKPSTTARDSATPPPHPAAVKPHVLAAHSTGITKRAQKSKPLKRAQRLRQLKGMERAEENMDKFELKVAKSVGRERRVKERSKAWDEINGDGKRRKGKKENAFAGLEDEGGEKKGVREWGADADMDEAAPEAPEAAPEVAGEGKEVEGMVKPSVPLALEEDEAL